MKDTFGFPVTITARHEELTDQIKIDITENLQKLTKYYSHIIDADVTIDYHAARYTVEISLQLPGSVIVSRADGYDQLKALDLAIEKTKTQVKKLKSKVVDHRAILPEPVIEVESAEESDLID